MAAATAFYDAPDLMTVWVELDEHGRAVSAVNIGSDDLMVLSGKNVPGTEMLLFLSKLAEDETYPVAKRRFPCSKKYSAKRPKLCPL